MKLKTISLIGILLLTLNSFAQQGRDYKGFYVSIGYELGLLSVDLQDTKTPLIDSEVSSRLRHSIPFSVSYRTEEGLDFELGYFPSQNTIGLKGKSFKITNSYFSHTAFAGVGYSIPITRFLDIRTGVGASMTFVGDEKINETEKNLTITNETVEKRNTHIVIPLSIVKHFRNGNQLVFGAKYYHSLNDDFIKGDITITAKGKKTSYSTLNNAIALYISYGFKIETVAEGCGCLF
ncbi:MAG: hypothetical protein KGV44_09870 [Flavobacteriaceae bacterium]|nr:hypothetical protein [Flavobacteriaceae bacterium]